MLNIENLHASYGGSLVLHGVNLSIGSGRDPGAHGPERNGENHPDADRHGTSSDPVRNQSLLTAKPIQGLRTHEIAAKGLGYVPQGREIFGDFTVWENLHLGTLKLPRNQRKIPEESF